MESFTQMMNQGMSGIAEIVRDSSMFLIQKRMQYAYACMPGCAYLAHKPSCQQPELFVLSKKNGKPRPKIRGGQHRKRFQKKQGYTGGYNGRGRR